MTGGTVWRPKLAAATFALMCLSAGYTGEAGAADVAVLPEHSLADIEKRIELASLPRVSNEALQPGASQPRREAQAPRYVTLVIGGDLGLGGSGQPVVASAGVRQGRRYEFSDLTRHLHRLIKGDLLFANLETVVTDSNRLGATDKKFNFRMHPAGVAHLVRAGFNVLSTANNHAIDFGRTGMRHTIANLESLAPEGLLAAHGVSDTTEAMFTPARFARRGASFAFAAIGIGGVRATNSTPGQIHFRNADDFERITATLGRAQVDFRILSVHYGEELQVRPDKVSRSKLAEQAVTDNGIDLVIGHHAHTPAGIERIGNRYVFYGLGNLLHLGMQDMSRHDICRDFGLLAKLHLVSDAANEGRLKVHAIELVTLSDMHLASRARTGGDGRRRIEVINHLGRGLDGGHGTGVQFRPRQDGSGLYCAPGASADRAAMAVVKGRAGPLCADWQPPPLPDAATRKRIAHACRYMRKQPANTLVAKARGAKTPAKSKKSRRAFMKTAFEPRD